MKLGNRPSGTPTPWKMMENSNGQLGKPSTKSSFAHGYANYQARKSKVSNGVRSVSNHA
jgi:hypothetical protein